MAKVFSLESIELSWRKTCAVFFEEKLLNAISNTWLGAGGEETSGHKFRNRP